MLIDSNVYFHPEDENRTDACLSTLVTLSSYPVCVSSSHMNIHFDVSCGFAQLFFTDTNKSSSNSPLLPSLNKLLTRLVSFIAGIDTVEGTRLLWYAKSPANVLYHQEMCSSSYLSTREGGGARINDHSETKSNLETVIYQHSWTREWAIARSKELFSQFPSRYAFALICLDMPIESIVGCGLKQLYINSRRRRRRREYAYTYSNWRIFKWRTNSSSSSKSTLIDDRRIMSI